MSAHIVHLKVVDLLGGVNAKCGNRSMPMVTPYIDRVTCTECRSHMGGKS